MSETNYSFATFVLMLAVIVAVLVVVLITVSEGSESYNCGPETIYIEGHEDGGIESADLRRLCIENLQERRLIP